LRIGAGVVGLGARDDDQVVRAICKGDPHLLAVQDPLVAVQLGAAAHRGDVGPRPRLGHREGPQELAARDPRERLLRIVDREIGRGDQAGARDDAGHAHPRARELLGDEAVLEHPEPEAPVLLGHQDAEEAELPHSLADLGRDLALLRVESVRGGEHLLHRELARGLLDRLAFVRVVRGRDSGQQIVDLAHSAALRRATRFVRS
jgi:hypothetical protein